MFTCARVDTSWMRHWLWNGQGKYGDGVVNISIASTEVPISAVSPDLLIDGVSVWSSMEAGTFDHRLQRLLDNGTHTIAVQVTDEAQRLQQPVKRLMLLLILPLVVQCVVEEGMRRPLNLNMPPTLPRINPPVLKCTPDDGAFDLRRSGACGHEHRCKARPHFTITER